MSSTGLSKMAYVVAVIILHVTRKRGALFVGIPLDKTICRYNNYFLILLGPTHSFQELSYPL